MSPLRWRPPPPTACHFCIPPAEFICISLGIIGTALSCIAKSYLFHDTLCREEAHSPSFTPTPAFITHPLSFISILPHRDSLLVLPPSRFQDASKSWLTEYQDLIYEPMWPRYVAALFWSTMTITTIGYGEVMSYHVFIPWS